MVTFLHPCVSFFAINLIELVNVDIIFSLKKGRGLRGGKWVLYLKLSMREVYEWASWNQLSIDWWQKSSSRVHFFGENVLPFYYQYLQWLMSSHITSLRSSMNQHCILHMDGFFLLLSSLLFGSFKVPGQIRTRDLWIQR